MKAVKFTQKLLKFQLTHAQYEAMDIFRGFLPLKTERERLAEFRAVRDIYPEVCDLVKKRMEAEIKSLQTAIKEVRPDGAQKIIESRIASSLIEMYDACR